MRLPASTLDMYIIDDRQTFLIIRTVMEDGWKKEEEEAMAVVSGGDLPRDGRGSIRLRRTISVPGKPLFSASFLNELQGCGRTPIRCHLYPSLPSSIGRPELPAASIGNHRDDRQIEKTRIKYNEEAGERRILS